MLKLFDHESVLKACQISTMVRYHDKVTLSCQNLEEEGGTSFDKARIFHQVDKE